MPLECFLDEFNEDEPVDLVLSIDNRFAKDGFKNTEERLEHYGLGISWTIDEENGKWFRNRVFRKQRYLFEGLVDKKDIIVYLKSRGEEEVIINPINIKDIKKIG